MAAFKPLSGPSVLEEEALVKVVFCSTLCSTLWCLHKMLLCSKVSCFVFCPHFFMCFSSLYLGKTVEVNHLFHWFSLGFFLGSREFNVCHYFSLLLSFSV